MPEGPHIEPWWAKTEYERNPISGHVWPKPPRQVGWLVTGGLWPTRKFRSLAKAQEWLEFRLDYDKNWRTD